MLWSSEPKSTVVNEWDPVCQCGLSFISALSVHMVQQMSLRNTEDKPPVFIRTHGTHPFGHQCYCEVFERRRVRCWEQMEKAEEEIRGSKNLNVIVSSCSLQK